MFAYFTYLCIKIDFIENYFAILLLKSNVYIYIDTKINLSNNKN